MAPPKQTEEPKSAEPIKEVVKKPDPKKAEVQAEAKKDREDLGQIVQGPIKHEAEEALGRPLDSIKTNNADDFCAAMERLAEVFGKAMDKLYAIFAGFGVKREEVDTTLNKPGEASTDDVKVDIESETAPASTNVPSTNGRNLNRAMDASAKLAAHPDWKKNISECSSKYGFAESSIIAIIEMESNFDPEAIPKNKEGKVLSSAVGLAQATYTAAEEYRREGHPNADLKDPATAIDFIGFHLEKKIKEANYEIAKNGFPDSLKLSKGSPLKDLYLAYNSGGLGYALVRAYETAKTQEEKDAIFARMPPFQREDNDKNGLKGWQERNAYAMRVEEVARLNEQLDTNDVKLAHFASSPLALSLAITSRFGGRIHPKEHTAQFHNGIDLAAPVGTAVQSVNEGRVVRVESNRGNSKVGAGNYVAIQHTDGSTTEYMHLSATNVSEGQHVDAGTKIGEVGSTGMSTGPHLHFTYIDKNGVPQNPQKALFEAA